MNTRKKKTLGILGGMGPYASLDFARRIVERTPAPKDWDHIRTIHDSAVHIPSRTRAVLLGEQSPVPGMIEAIQALTVLGVEVVTVPCNSAHFFYPEVAPNIEVPWLNMIEFVSKELDISGKKRPLILGGPVTITRKTYNAYVDSAYLNDAENSEVYALVEAIKTNNLIESEALGASVAAHIEHLRVATDVDALVLGCTELSRSRALTAMEELPVFDSTDIYAQKTVEYCLGAEPLQNH